MNIRLEDSWKTALASEFEEPYFKRLRTSVHEAYETGVAYPPPSQIFAALDTTPLPTVKVVILGQDPYHGPKQANGLAFSVNAAVAIPPSLQNIFKEIRRDVGNLALTDGDLTPWAKQGVLLLNSTLTVPHGQAGGHQPFGWEQFTDSIISVISETREHVVFLLWGAFAIAKRRLVDETKHLVLTAPHPSPLSAHRGFIGCSHFSQANHYLTKHDEEPIIW